MSDDKTELMPWQQPPLNEWSICGMNHYHVNGEKYLFVSIVKDGVCITEEGEDNKHIWNRLWHKATGESKPACKHCGATYTGGLKEDGEPICLTCDVL
jgi:hypothetical protein